MFLFQESKLSSLVSTIHKKMLEKGMRTLLHILYIAVIRVFIKFLSFDIWQFSFTSNQSIIFGSNPNATNNNETFFSS